MIENTIALVALFVIMCVSAGLIWANHYEDALLGRISLVGMSFTSFVVLLSALNGSQYIFSPPSIVFFLSVAVFLSRHAYRFWRFNCDGRFGWKRKAAP